MEERHKMEQGGFLGETLRQTDKGDICFQDELDGQRGRMRRQSGLPQASPSYELYYDNLYTLRQSGTKRSATSKYLYKVKVKPELVYTKYNNVLLARGFPFISFTTSGA